MDKVQVEIVGISTSPASNGAYTLILRETAGNRRIPIIIGGFEAQAIALEMEGIKPSRPLTHDLIKTVIQQLSATITEVTITDLKEGTFYATLNLNGEEEIDSRPSDAIAIAVRFGINIYVAEHVMAEAGFVGEESEDDLGEDDESLEANIDERLAEAKPEEVTVSGKSKPKSKLEQLNQQLEEAIQKEDYEKAATIRDDIEKLKGKEKS